MKDQFVEKHPGPKKMHLIATADIIINEYQKEGYRLTLRQLYYQFVSRNIISNSEKSYKNLGEAVSDGRLMGLLDWDAIEDRVRVPKLPQQFDDLKDLVDTALGAYRLPRWKGQAEYVELWVEKDALAGVLAPLANQYHVTLMVNRGYSSQSAMHEASKRFLRAAAGDGKYADVTPVLLYLGDHDPSGEDMVRDIRDRMEMFGVFDLEVQKVALTMEQVKTYNPPPNPAKLSDSRAGGYVAKHGMSSWEVDALPPDVLENMIRQAILNHLDVPKMKAVIAQEERDKKSLRLALSEIKKEKGE